MAAELTSVVDVYIPEKEMVQNPKYLKDFVKSTSQADVGVGDTVIIGGTGGVARMLAIADGRNGCHILANIALTHNTHPVTKDEFRWFAANVIDEAAAKDEVEQSAVREVAPFTYIVQVNGEPVATIVMLGENLHPEMDSIMGVPVIKLLNTPGT